jgi:small subunit ribosomal protein S1
LDAAAPELLEDQEIPATPPKERDAPMTMMELLMAEGEFLPEPHSRGDLIRGRVLRKDDNQLIVDIGAKQEGMVPASDLMRLPKEVVDAIEVGDEVEAVVLRPEGREGGVLVSLSQAMTLADWSRAHDLMESGDVLELEVVGHNKGGGLVGFGNLQGFVPRSHLIRLASVNDPDAVMRGLADMVGETLAVKVIEVSRRKRRLIMSERLAVREWRTDRKKRLLDELHEGDIRRGRVSSVADFGAFVDLGGADGLVHVSELTHERGRHPKDVVSVGQEVDVYVLSIDRERQRIGLSMRRLQADPWETVEEDHYVGELVEVEISNLAKFGAFARLEDGIEGLIHISELSDGHVEHPREAVRPGQRVTVEIIAIEPHRQRVGLSIRRVPKHLRHLEEMTEEAYEPAAREEPEAATGELAEPTDAHEPDVALDQGYEPVDAEDLEPEPPEATETLAPEEAESLMAEAAEDAETAENAGERLSDAADDARPLEDEGVVETEAPDAVDGDESAPNVPLTAVEEDALALLDEADAGEGSAAAADDDSLDGAAEES